MRGLGHRGAGASQDRTFGERAKVPRRRVAWGVVKRALGNQCWSQINDVSVDSVILSEFPGAWGSRNGPRGGPCRRYTDGNGLPREYDS